MPHPTRAALRAADTLGGAFRTTVGHQRARQILDALAAGPIEDSGGRAVRALAAHVEFAFENDTRRLQYVTRTLEALEAHGWVVRNVNGRRTTRIALGPTAPTDWTPPPTGGRVQSWSVSTGLVAPPATNGRVEPPEEPPRNTPRTPPRAEVGGRPGRFVARLERELPAMVRDAVVAAMADERRTTLAALGYVPEGDTAPGATAALDQAHAEVAALRDEVALMTRNLAVARADAHMMREEYNRLAAKSVSVDAPPLRPADVHADLRDVAAHAIAHGWTIHRTNGGHLAFRSPAGGQTFTSATPSDWRAVKNLVGYLEGMGLPRRR